MCAPLIYGGRVPRLKAASVFVVGLAQIFRYGHACILTPGIRLGMNGDGTLEVGAERIIGGVAGMIILHGRQGGRLQIKGVGGNIKMGEFGAVGKIGKETTGWRTVEFLHKNRHLIGIERTEINTG